MIPTARELIWFAAYFTAGGFCGWLFTAAAHRVGVALLWVPTGLLVGGLFCVWLAGHRRYRTWLASSRGADDAPDVWMTTEDVGDSRSPREVS